MARRKRKSPARGVYWDVDAQVFRTDMRLKRIRGGRLAISLQTADSKEAESAAAAIRTVYHRGDYGAIERLRSGEISIGDFRGAVREGDFDRLRRISDDEVTLEQARDWILEEVADNRPKSVEKYVSITRALIARFGADTALRSIGREELLEWLREVKPKYSRPWKPAQRHQVFIVCKRMWKIANRRETLRAKDLGVLARPIDNPWEEDIPRPKVRPSRVVFLTGDEWRAIVNANRGLPRLALVATLTFAGLRLSEAGHLRVGVDVDMDERLIRIQPREGLHPWAIKNDRKRIIPMCDDLHQLLEEHLEAGYAPGKYLIRSADRDAPLHLSSLTRWVQDAFAAAEVTYGRDAEQGRTAHTCRHTFATWMLLRGVPLHVVADLMGDNAKTVLQTYAHLLPIDRQGAVKTLDEAARS